VSIHVHCEQCAVALIQRSAAQKKIVESKIKFMCHYKRGIQSSSQPVYEPVHSPVSEEDGEIESRRMSDARDYPVEEDPVILRRSARERKPKRMFTYETLGQPSIQPQAALSVAAYTLPYLPVWTTPYPVPHTFQITPYTDINTFRPFTSTMPVY